MIVPGLPSLHQTKNGLLSPLPSHFVIDSLAELTYTVIKYSIIDTVRTVI